MNKNQSNNNITENLFSSLTKLFIFSVGVFAFKKFLYSAVYKDEDQKNVENAVEKAKDKKKEIKNSVEDVADDGRDLAKETRNLIAHALTKASDAIKL